MSTPVGMHDSRRVCLKRVAYNIIQIYSKNGNNLDKPRSEKRTKSFLENKYIQ